MKRWRRVGVAVLGLVLAGNLANFVVPDRPVALGTCPTVVTDDGVAASVLAGALYPWAEREDVAPLPTLHETGGEARLRLENRGEATSAFVSQVQLLVVDHDEASEIFATPAGRLVAVRHSFLPTRRTPDGVELDRVEGRRALLVLEARSTPFAEKAFFRYLATMGRGVSPLMEHAVRTDCGTACAREVMDDELARLGLPLRVTVVGGSSTAIAPVSPALARRFAVPIELPETGSTITIRLEAVPRFWEIESVAIAPESADVPFQTIGGQTAQAEILASGHSDLRFAVPPLTSAKRSFFVAVRGHYSVPIGGALLHPITILEHRWGLISLPELAARLPP